MEYKELDVWIAGRKLVKEVYEISKSFPKEEQFGITNQIRRSAISIPSNIAEGCGRRRRTAQRVGAPRRAGFQAEIRLGQVHA